jgi:hypothetical protein
MFASLALVPCTDPTCISDPNPTSAHVVGLPSANVARASDADCATAVACDQTSIAATTVKAMAPPASTARLRVPPKLTSTSPPFAVHAIPVRELAKPTKSPRRHHDARSGRAAQRTEAVESPFPIAVAQTHRASASCRSREHRRADRLRDQVVVGGASGRTTSHDLATTSTTLPLRRTTQWRSPTNRCGSCRW